MVDAAYAGSGVGQPCAWNHPFWALPPGGAQLPQISAGDTLVIGTGSYRIGLGAPNTGDCEADWAWDCTMAPVPSGLSAAQPTRIVGAGWDGGCPAKPELWGAERIWQILDLTNSDDVVVSCLELTDHSSCIEFHTGTLECERDSPPFGPWASAGIVATDSSNATLSHLDIHGLASHGVHAGRITDWTVEDVRVSHNGWVGWDGDVDGDDSNSGTLMFRRFSVTWNGCGETYPGRQTAGCWAQTAGGYGDGLGTGTTAGHWVFEDSEFLYNTSDGLDLLYLVAPGQVEIIRTQAEGNAGNQIKINGPANISDSVIVGNCGFFDGQPFTYLVDNCRAAGNALSLFFEPGTQSALVGSTLYSEGDCILLLECAGSNGSESLLSRNNLFIGDVDFLSPTDRTCFSYSQGCSAEPLNQDYGLIFGVKNDPCPVGPNDVCGDPSVVSSAGDSLDGRLLMGSPALDTGTATYCSPVDWRGVICPQDGNGDGTADCDIGAFEATRTSNLLLDNETVDMRRTHEACTSIGATNYVMADPGDVTFETTGQIELGEGVAIGEGVYFRAALSKPSACP
jgi:hypothetical protein